LSLQRSGRGTRISVSITGIFYSIDITNNISKIDININTLLRQQKQ